jgi:hypothetical protein
VGLFAFVPQKHRGKKQSTGHPEKQFDKLREPIHNHIMSKTNGTTEPTTHFGWTLHTPIGKLLATGTSATSAAAHADATAALDRLGRKRGRTTVTEKIIPVPPSVALARALIAGRFAKDLGVARPKTREQFLAAAAAHHVAADAYFEAGRAVAAEEHVLSARIYTARAVPRVLPTMAGVLTLVQMGQRHWDESVFARLAIEPATMRDCELRGLVALDEGGGYVLTPAGDAALQNA